MDDTQRNRNFYIGIGLIPGWKVDERSPTSCLPKNLWAESNDGMRFSKQLVTSMDKEYQFVSGQKEVAKNLSQRGGEGDERRESANAQAPFPLHMLHSNIKLLRILRQEPTAEY